MLSVIGIVPVFFTYIVLLVELLGYSVPHASDVQFWLHWLFE
jgi:hypothetical protein